MLEDFIVANGLKAKIVPRNSGNLVKCRLFLAGNRPFLVIFPASKKLDFEKIRKELLSEIEVPEDNQVFEMTGYKMPFLPPVSIYVERVLVDKGVFGAGMLHCHVSETESLEISADEIAENSEGVCIGHYSG